jgi:hypothetical protein
VAGGGASVHEVVVAELVDEVEVRETEHDIRRGSACHGEVYPVWRFGGGVRARGEQRGRGEGWQRHRAFAHSRWWR